MVRLSLRVLLLVMALAVCSVMAGCKTAGTAAPKAAESAAPAAAAPAPAADPMIDLGKRMFLLPDGRDMSFIVVRVTRLGVSEDSVRNAAQSLVFDDFRAYLGEVAQAHRVIYLGNGRFRVDALQYALNSESFNEASFVLHLTRFTSEGHTIDGIILDEVLLNGQDFTGYAGLRVYERLLERKAGL